MNENSTDAEIKKQKRRDDILKLYTTPGANGEKPLSARQIAKRLNLARSIVTADLRFLGKNPHNNIVIHPSKISGIKWSKALNTVANERLPYYRSRGNPFPSLRTVFYDLEERKLIGGDDCP